MKSGVGALDKPETKPNKVVRFSANQRLQHAVVMVSFVVLVVTGVPQLAPENDWARWIIQNVGGIHSTRLVHRSFGFVFTFAAVYHFGFILHHVFARRRPLSLLLTARDFRDVLDSTRYELGLSSRRPRLGRYDFGQKFEYWGMLFGGAVMIISGLMLMYPVWATKLLPGQFIPAAKEAHGYEAVMALLIVLVWHMFSAHLGPGRFPMDTSIFTGRISKERLRDEHPIEFEDLFGEEARPHVDAADAPEQAETPQRPGSQ